MVSFPIKNCDFPIVTSTITRGYLSGDLTRKRSPPPTLLKKSSAERLGSGVLPLSSAEGCNQKNMWYGYSMVYSGEWYGLILCMITLWENHHFY